MLPMQGVLPGNQGRAPGQPRARSQATESALPGNLREVISQVVIISQHRFAFSVILCVGIVRQLYLALFFLFISLSFHMHIVYIYI